MKATQDKPIDGGDVFCEDAVQDSGGRVVWHALYHFTQNTRFFTNKNSKLIYSRVFSDWANIWVQDEIKTKNGHLRYWTLKPMTDFTIVCMLW